MHSFGPLLIDQERRQRYQVYHIIKSTSKQTWVTVDAGLLMKGTSVLVHKRKISNGLNTWWVSIPCFVSRKQTLHFISMFAYSSDGVVIGFSIGDP